MRFLNFLILFIMLIFLAGCKGEDTNPGEFVSEKYGFSFLFPKNWNEVTKDLPDKWAILNGQDTILFTVNEAQVKDLLNLGKLQAFRDLYLENDINMLEQERVDEINDVVKLKSFNNKDWYTYAIEFPSENVNSIVSGALCGEYEVNIVMVSSFNSYEENKVIYNDILDSFEC